MCRLDIRTPPQNGPFSPSTAPSTFVALTRAATQGQSWMLVSLPPVILFRMWDLEEIPHPAGLSTLIYKLRMKD